MVGYIFELVFLTNLNSPVSQVYPELSNFFSSFLPQRFFHAAKRVDVDEVKIGVERQRSYLFEPFVVSHRADFLRSITFDGRERGEAGMCRERSFRRRRSYAVGILFVLDFIHVPQVDGTRLPSDRM